MPYCQKREETEGQYTVWFICLILALNQSTSLHIQANKLQTQHRLNNGSVSRLSMCIVFFSSNTVLHDRKCSSELVLFLNQSLFQVVFMVTLNRFHPVGYFLLWIHFFPVFFLCMITSLQRIRGRLVATARVLKYR